MFNEKYEPYEKTKKQVDDFLQTIYCKYLQQTSEC